MTATPDPWPSLDEIEAAAAHPGPAPALPRGAALAERMEELGRSNHDARMAARARTADAERRRDAQQRRDNLRRSLGWITERFYDFAPASLGDDDGVTAWAADAVAGRCDGLLLLGPTGVGKTWQAVAAYRAVCEDLGCEGYAIRADEFTARIVPSAADPLRLRPLIEADLLLLDDLGGGLTDYATGQLLRVIDARATHAGRLSIITSNLRAPELRPALGDRIASRLNGHARVVAMNGPDRRHPGGGGASTPTLPLR